MYRVVICIKTPCNCPQYLGRTRLAGLVIFIQDGIYLIARASVRQLVYYNMSLAIFDGEDIVLLVLGISDGEFVPA